jgi:hypothetical protein
MKGTNEALKIAVRVLGALSDHVSPEPTDIAALKGFAPLLAAAPVDELACEVIQQSLRRRTEALTKAARN